MKKKIVTICGSMRFWQEMLETAEILEIEQDCAVLCPVPHVQNRKLTDAEKEKLSKLHMQKIDLSDAIFVVNKGGYMGESVRREIAYAKAQGKEILYLEACDE